MSLAILPISTVSLRAIILPIIISSEFCGVTPLSPRTPLKNRGPPEGRLARSARLGPSQNFFSITALRAGARLRLAPSPLYYVRLLRRCRRHSLIFSLITLILSHVAIRSIVQRPICYSQICRYSIVVLINPYAAIRSIVHHPICRLKSSAICRYTTHLLAILHYPNLHYPSAKVADTSLADHSLFPINPLLIHILAIRSIAGFVICHFHVLKLRHSPIGLHAKSSMILKSFCHVLSKCNSLNSHFIILYTQVGSYLSFT